MAYVTLSNTGLRSVWRASVAVGTAVWGWGRGKTEAGAIALVRQAT